jgi:hypothetical protein
MSAMMFGLLGYDMRKTKLSRWLRTDRKVMFELKLIGSIQLRWPWLEAKPTISAALPALTLFSAPEVLQGQEVGGPQARIVVAHGWAAAASLSWATIASLSCDNLQLKSY